MASTQGSLDASSATTDVSTQHHLAGHGHTGVESKSGLEMPDVNEKAVASDVDDPEAAKDVGDVEPVTPAGPRANLSTIKWALTVLSVALSCFLYGLDTTISADVQGTILERFQEPEKLAWIGVGFTLGSIAVALAVGKAYATFNMKWLYLASLVLFEVGSALCGAAPSMNALIVGRVIAGAGGSGFYIGSLNIMTALTAERERPPYMGGVAFIWGLGLILGPVIGGAFSQSSATWRWSFYINLVIFAICSPVYIFIIPGIDQHPGTKLIDRMKMIDWTGSLLNAGVWTSFVLAMTFGGAQWPWNDGRTIATFVVCGVLIIVFGVQQVFTIGTTYERRVLPVGFLKSRDIMLQYLVTCVMGVTLALPVYYLPIFFQFTRNDGPVEAAVRILPFVIMVIFFSMVNGALMPQFGYYQPWFVVSAVLLVIGSTLMFTVHADTSNAKVYGYSILMGVGTGLSFAAAYSIAPIKVAMDKRFGPRMIPDGIGWINMAQIGSILLGLTIAGTLFQNLSFNYLKAALGGMGFSDAELHSAISGVKSQLFVNASSETTALAVDAIIKALDHLYILCIAGSAFMVLCAACMRWEKLFMKPE